jgi:hypothetical protein
MFLEGTFLLELTVSFSFIASRAEIIAFQRTEPPQKRKPKVILDAVLDYCGCLSNAWAEAV